MGWGSLPWSRESDAKAGPLGLALSSACHTWALPHQGGQTASSPAQPEPSSFADVLIQGMTVL